MTSKATPLTSFFKEKNAQFIEVHGVLVPLRFKNVGEEYQAAREKTLVCEGGHRSLIRIKGKDVFDFLQRILSSDLRELENQPSQASAMLDQKGHFIAELDLHRMSSTDNSWDLIIDTPYSSEKKLIEKLNLYKFSEDVEWEVLNWARVRVIGNDIACEKATYKVMRTDCGQLCTEYFFKEEDGVSSLIEIFREKEVMLGGWVAQDILRVESNISLFEADFNSDFTLPAANHWHRASLDKGCYAGQEVLARINTYGEAPKQLAPIRFNGDPSPMHNAKIYNLNGKEVGLVSSWVFSPIHDQPCAFGYLRKKAIHSGEKLLAKLGDVSRECYVAPQDAK